MSDWELVDDGSWNGLRKWLRATDDEEGTVEVKYEDVSGGAVVEENKRSEGRDKRSDLWHVAHIPASVGLKWLVEDGLDIWSPDEEMRKRVLRRAMDSDYRHLVPGMHRIIL
jgi:nitrogen fixation protein